MIDDHDHTVIDYCLAVVIQIADSVVDGEAAGNTGPNPSVMEDWQRQARSWEPPTSVTVLRDGDVVEFPVRGDVFEWRQFGTVGLPTMMAMAAYSDEDIDEEILRGIEVMQAFFIIKQVTLGREMVDAELPGSAEFRRFFRELHDRGMTPRALVETATTGDQAFAQFMNLFAGLVGTMAGVLELGMPYATISQSVVALDLGPLAGPHAGLPLPAIGSISVNWVEAIDLDPNPDTVAIFARGNPCQAPPGYERRAWEYDPATGTLVQRN